MKYAALITRSIFIPGDERSRTNPGHGYPESYEDTIEILKFANKKEMERWVETTTDSKYSLIEYVELNVVKKVSFEIKKEN